MTKKLLSLAFGGLLLIQAPVVLRAGGFLESIDITGHVPSPIAGQLVARVIPIRWDVRSIPVKFQVNTTLDPIPNALGAPFLTVAQLTPALQASFDSWNQIPTSYIDMRIEGTTNNPGLRRFDFRNELTFRTAATFTAVASSPSTSLIEDAVFENGDDIDGDGDSDVSDAIMVAADVDHDGDTEFPAGFYKAGTILDNDVQFNTKTTNGLRFTIDPAAVDINSRSVDLIGVATHEFGHSFGLSHSMDNQLSEEDGTSSTMFPAIDTGDPASELSERTLESDDIAWASLHYPEGTSKWGVAALQPGDVAYSKVYGLITGEVQHGVLDQPVAGASAYAIDRNDDRVVASGFSGTTQVSFDPVTGGLFLIDPAFDILDGVYNIPVPKGTYSVGIEAVDGQPVSSGSIGLTAQIGDIFGQLNFTEEFFNKNKEGAVEINPGQGRNVHVSAGKVSGDIDFTTAKNLNINNFGNRNFIGFTASPAGRMYAVRIPASQVTAAAALAGGKLALQAALFDTAVVDASVAPIFAEAVLAAGTASADGATVALDLEDPWDRVEGFLGQDGDMATFFFDNPRQLGRQILHAIATGEITNLFLVLRIPTSTPFPGVSAIPPLIGLDGGVAPNDVPIFGLSYISDDGGVTFTQVTTFNFRFSLGVSELP